MFFTSHHLMSEESGNALERQFCLKVSHEGAIIWRLDWVQRIGLQGSSVTWLASWCQLLVNSFSSFACGLSWRLSECAHDMTAGFPQSEQRKSQMKIYPFYDLALEVTYPHFCLILFITNEPLSSAQTQVFIFRRERWQRMCGYILKHNILKLGIYPN